MTYRFLFSRPRASTLFASALFLIGLAAQAAPQGATAQVGGMKLGPFKLFNVGGTATVKVRNVSGTTVVFNGPRLSLTSQRYDIAAPHMTLLLKTNTPQTADADGGVRIAVRNPEQKQDTVLTSNTARYVAGKVGQNAHIYVDGNVRAVTRTPDLDPASPLITQSQKAVIELLPNQEYNIDFDGIEATGSPLEKPTKPATPRTKKP